MNSKYTHDLIQDWPAYISIVLVHVFLIFLAFNNGWSIVYVLWIFFMHTFFLGLAGSVQAFITPAKKIQARWYGLMGEGYKDVSLSKKYQRRQAIFNFCGFIIFYILIFSLVYSFFSQGSSKIEFSIFETFLYGGVIFLFELVVAFLGRKILQVSNSDKSNNRGDEMILYPLARTLGTWVILIVSMYFVDENFSRDVMLITIIFLSAIVDIFIHFGLRYRDVRPHDFFFGK